MNRNNTNKIKVGNVQIGGQNKVVIQSMCNTKTKDIEATVKQILGGLLRRTCAAEDQQGTHYQGYYDCKLSH